MHEEKIDGVDWNNGLVSNINRSNAGGIVTLDVGGVNIKGTEFRNIFSLRSANVENIARKRQYKNERKRVRSRRRYEPVWCTLPCEAGKDI